MVVWKGEESTEYFRASISSSISGLSSEKLEAYILAITLSNAQMIMRLIQDDRFIVKKSFYTYYFRFYPSIYCIIKSNNSEDFVLSFFKVIGKVKLYTI